MVVFWIVLFMSLVFVFIQLIHPMVLSMCVIVAVLMMIAFLGMNFSSFWLSYVILLVFLGGLLVVFVYISSLSGNEPVFIFSWWGGLFLMFLVFLKNLFLEVEVEMNYSSGLDVFYCLVSVYFSNNIMFVVFLLYYLFFLLLMVSDLTKFLWGPLSMIFGK